MVKNILKFAVILLVFVQCSSSEESVTRKIKRDPFFIHREEIEASHYDNAYDLISLARPEWLRPKVFHSFNFEKRSLPNIYVNGVLYGRVSSLTSVKLTYLQEIEYIRPIDTTERFGTNHNGGALYLTVIR